MAYPHSGNAATAIVVNGVSKVIGETIIETAGFKAKNLPKSFSNQLRGGRYIARRYGLITPTARLVATLGNFINLDCVTRARRCVERWQYDPLPAEMQ